MKKNWRRSLPLFQISVCTKIGFFGCLIRKFSWFGKSGPVLSVDWSLGPTGIRQACKDCILKQIGVARQPFFKFVFLRNGFFGFLLRKFSRIANCEPVLSIEWSPGTTGIRQAGIDCKVKQIGVAGHHFFKFVFVQMDFLGFYLGHFPDLPIPTPFSLLTGRQPQHGYDRHVKTSK